MGEFTSDQNIKELEQVNIILKELNEMLVKKEIISDETFLSMSHELRTPAVSIKAYTDMLLGGDFGKLSQEQHEKLERIHTNTSLLFEVIFKLLEMKEDLIKKL